MSAEPGAWLEMHAWATPGPRRNVLRVHSRPDRRNPLTGVFAIHGTPVVDIKPVLR